MTTKTEWTELPDTDPVFIRENKKAMKRERLAGRTPFPLPGLLPERKAAVDSAHFAMRLLRENLSVAFILRELMNASDRMESTGQALSDCGRDVEASAGYLKMAFEAAGGRL